jgi:hypothetical protein
MMDTQTDSRDARDQVRHEPNSRPVTVGTQTDSRNTVLVVFSDDDLDGGSAVAK